MKIKNKVGRCETTDVWEYNGNEREYWKDGCPICGELAISSCRCYIGDRRCKNNHEWHWVKGKKVIGCGHTDGTPPARKKGA